MIALIAPRPVYIASAERDGWADPRGEFLAALAAGPVYQLLGATGIAAGQTQESPWPVGEMIGYHRRPGGHGLTDFDWDRFVDFADRRFPGDDFVLTKDAGKVR